MSGAGQDTTWTPQCVRYAHIQGYSGSFYTLNERTKGNYSIDCETAEPDAHIADLNTELVKCDDLVSTCLPVRERQ